MKIIEQIGKGNRGIVYKAIIDNQIVAIKYANNEAIDREYKILQMLDGFYAPKPILKTDKFFAMEFIDAKPLKHFQNTPTYDKILQLALIGAYELDKLNISHGQLGRYYHILYHKNIKFIDFEKSANNARNVLQIIGYYFMRDRRYDKKILLSLINDYKKTKKIDNIIEYIRGINGNNS